MNPLADIPGLKKLIEQADGGAPEIQIAVIDGPVDPQHPAFQGTAADSKARLVSLSGDSDTTRSSHGTHVASIIAGQPGSPVAGIAPGCTLLSIPVYREDANGNLISCAQATLARAIRHALDSGARLINISGGQFTPTGQGDRFLEAAVRDCAERNVLIVAAAGNDGCRCLHVPAALPTVLAVGACDLTGKPMPFSNHGDAYHDNGILAPGEAIPGAGPDGSVTPRSGTSFATPIVTAVAALLLSRQLRSGGEVDTQAVRRLLLDTARPLDPPAAPGHRHGPVGILNVEAALEALQSASPSSAQSRPQDAAPLAPAATQRPSSLPLAADTQSARFLPPSPPPRNPSTGEAIAMSENYPTSGHAPSALLGPDGTPLSAAAPAQLAPAAIAATAEAPPGSAISPAEAPTPSAPPSLAATAVAPAGEPSAAVPAPQVAVPQIAAHQAAAHQVAPLAATPAAPAIVPAGAAPLGITPNQSCGCGGLSSSAAGVLPSQVVGESPIFVIGRLYYDFESEARFDYFVQAIAEWRKQVDPNNYQPGGDYAAPWNAEIMIKYLLFKNEAGVLVHFPDSNALIWTLNIDTAPIYAIKPQDAFGFPMYLELASMLWEQEVAEPFNTGVNDVTGIGAGPKPPTKQSKKKPPVERVSQAGYIDGEVRLMNGTVVPQLKPVWRGMFGWNTDDIAGKTPPPHFKEFLERIYNQFRNVGVSPQDRAMNYSAFNAYNTRKIFYEMAHESPNPMFLDSVSIDRSTICRPDSDCWDATWTFFDPTATLTTARKVFQYTVDVSDVVPVTVGPLRDWMIF